MMQQLAQMLGLETKVAWGIVAGICTFLITVITVVVLLIAGGSIQRLKEELNGSAPPISEPTRPRLLDDLLDASTKKKEKPTWSSSIEIILKYGVETASRGLIKRLVLKTCSLEEAQKSWDGKPRWGLHDPYQPITVWHELPNTQDALLLIGIYDEDNLIGSISLYNHRPQHLAISIHFLWLHPAYLDQHRTLALVASFPILEHLFQQKYRRIEFLCDASDTYRRKLAHSLGFQPEGILRKHMILNERNRDSALASLLNSEWLLSSEIFLLSASISFLVIQSYFRHHLLRNSSSSPQLQLTKEDDDDEITVASVNNLK